MMFDKNTRWHVRRQHITVDHTRMLSFVQRKATLLYMLQSMSS